MWTKVESFQTTDGKLFKTKRDAVMNELEYIHRHESGNAASGIIGSSGWEKSVVESANRVIILLLSSCSEYHISQIFKCTVFRKYRDALWSDLQRENNGLKKFIEANNFSMDKVNEFIEKMNAAAREDAKEETKEDMSFDDMIADRP